MVELCDRTEESVKIYFEKTNKKEIQQFLPQKAKSVEEALKEYKKTLLPNATSYGRTIWVNQEYIGDIWCYAINKNESPNAMISYCIFNMDYWKKGIASEALKLFLDEIYELFQLECFGAFTYSDNVASIRVLEKNNFELKEIITEDGIESKYYSRAYCC